MGVREDIVAYCRRQVGCSYSTVPSGGKEGQSYNCSYLSTCAYRAAGLTIPGWQGHQNGDGSQSDWVWRNGHWTTDKSKLLPGDLVFFGEHRGSTSHVAVVSRAGSTPYIIDSTPPRGVAERALPTGAGFVGGGWPLAELPEAGAAKAAECDLFKGRYTFVRKATNIRTAPSLSATVTGSYAKGETVTLDGTVAYADGYLWGRYTGASTGAHRWVAVATMDFSRPA